MEIGIPYELRSGEHRVGLTPQGVHLLTKAGHQCYVEKGAGEGAGFRDVDYEKAGGRIVYNPEEVYQRADLVLKVERLTREELELTREGQAICAFWHLATKHQEFIKNLLEKNITTIGYETIQEEDGFLPVLQPLSEIAGRMVPQIAAQLLTNNGGGRGELLSGVAGVPPVDVVILGGGTVGIHAARTFAGIGAQVIVLDSDLRRLQYVERTLFGQVVTLVSHDFNIQRVTSFADVLVGAILVPGGERTPTLVTREMVADMKDGSVIIDVSIDQGGCIETSRPTTHSTPTYVEEGVIHYCVPNVSGVVARTSTNAFLNAAWPYIQMVANQGVQQAIERSSALRAGVSIHNGEIYNQRLAKRMGEV